MAELTDQDVDSIFGGGSDVDTDRTESFTDDTVDDLFSTPTTGIDRQRQPQLRDVFERSVVGEGAAALGRSAIRFGSSIAKFKDGVGTSISQNLQSLFGPLTPGDEEITPGIDPRIKRLEGLLTSDALRRSETFDLGQVKMTNPRFWVNAFGETAVPISAQIGAAVAAGPATFLAKALSFAGPAVVQSAGEGYAEALEDLTGPDGPDLTPREVANIAAAEGLVHGMVTAITNVGEFGFLIGRNPAISGAIAMSMRARVASVIKTAARAGAAESIQEPLENAVNEVATFLRKKSLSMTEQEFENFILSPEFLEKRVTEAIVAFPIGMFIRGGFEVSGVSSQVRNFNQARDLAIDQSLIQLDAPQQIQLAQELEAEIESPDTSEFDKQNMRKFVERIRRQGGITLSGDAVDLSGKPAELDLESDLPQSQVIDDPFASLESLVDGVFNTRNTIINRAKSRIKDAESKITKLKADSEGGFNDAVSKIELEIASLENRIAETTVDQDSIIKNLESTI
ncbi:MAG: hypothetical protein OES34_12565, partial [Nitrosopumilus sp.]|nr:hypothetical protein [Nitrosopumilus sp.]